MKASSSVTITIPLCEADRAFLRVLRNAGGRLQLITLAHKTSAKACREAGYVEITDAGRIVRLLGQGQAYLDKLARAH